MVPSARFDERGACGLVGAEELLELVGGSQGEGSGEELLALANIAREDGFADYPQIEAGLVAGDLRVEWRIAIGEAEGEAELIGIEGARGLDIGDEQLCFGRNEDGAWGGLKGFSGHSVDS